MSRATKSNRPKERDEEETDAQAEAMEKEREAIETIEDYIKDCRALLNHELISNATRAGYEGMFEGLLEEKKVEWARESAGFIEKTIDRAGRDRDQMRAKLNEEKGSLFTDADAKEMDEWFLQDGMMDLVRKETWQARVEEFVHKHATVAKRRGALLAKLSGLDDADAEGVSVLADDESFLRLSPAGRVNLMNRLEALDLAAMGGKKKLFRETDALLKRASTGKERYLHSASTGGLLKQMMASGKPERFREDTLLPSLDEHRATRSSFDSFSEELISSEEPPIATPKLDTFLRWDAGKRSSFIDEGRRRLRAIGEERESVDEELEEAKRMAEARMRKEDWDGALALLEDAGDRFPGDADLAVMRAYLDEHRADAEEEREEEEMERINMEINAIIATVSPDLRTLYVAMAMQGPEEFRAFAKAMGRGVKRQANARIDDEEEDKPDSEEGDEEEIVAAGETPDDQRAAAEEWERSDEAEKTLTLLRISAEAQQRYASSVNKPLEAKLAELHGKGGVYQTAA